MRLYDKVGSSAHPDCEAQEKAVRAEDLAGVCAAAGNALEECSGARDNEAIKAALRQHGAVTALMTGSGAAVFGVFPTEEAARGAAEALKAQWPQVYVAQPDKGGARVVGPEVAACNAIQKAAAISVTASPCQLPLGGAARRNE